MRTQILYWPPTNSSRTHTDCAQTRDRYTGEKMIFSTLVVRKNGEDKQGCAVHMDSSC
jgi:hypothetical protein